jgi:hypothetical protein
MTKSELKAIREELFRDGIIGCTYTYHFPEGDKQFFVAEHFIAIIENSVKYEVDQEGNIIR